MQLTKNRQTGMSLLSLMIGLLISMIAILGMMSLFSNSVKTTTQSSRDARITGERASGLLIAGIHLQSAGYGVVNANRSEHLQLLSAATRTDNRVAGTPIGNDGTGNVLIWQVQPAAQSRCAGLYAPSGDAEKGLYELVEKDCASISDASASDWEFRRLIFDTQDIQTLLAVTITLTTHDITTPCRGFGVAGAGSISITLNAAEASGQTLNSTTCLLNFSVTPGVTP
ncbi:PilW family protein [Cellvibrio polysaccharolyticus]|nr:hypothetical protein [Cellvibrio polysaccharolyticus]